MKRPKKCKHEGPFAVVSLTNFLTGGLKGRIGEEGATEPQILCCQCGALRYRKSWNGPRWSASLAEEVADPTFTVFPEGSAIVVHRSNIRDEEQLEQAGDAAFAWWVDLDYGRRLLYARLRPEDLPRAERDAANFASAR
jgi:hypothetical protein